VGLDDENRRPALSLVEAARRTVLVSLSSFAPALLWSLLGPALLQARARRRRYDGRTPSETP
jgi:hypothetical protein